MRKRGKREAWHTCDECGASYEYYSTPYHYCSEDDLVSQAIKTRDILKLKNAQGLLEKSMSRHVYGDARRRRWTDDPNNWLETATPEEREYAVSIAKRYYAVIAAAWARP